MLTFRKRRSLVGLGLVLVGALLLAVAVLHLQPRITMVPQTMEGKFTVNLWGVGGPRQGWFRRLSLR